MTTINDSETAMKTFILKEKLEVVATLGMGMFEKGTVLKVFNDSKEILFLPDDKYYCRCKLEFNKIHGHPDCIYK